VVDRVRKDLLQHRILFLRSAKNVCAEINDANPSKVGSPRKKGHLRANQQIPGGFRVQYRTLEWIFAGRAAFAVEFVGKLHRWRGSISFVFVDIRRQRR
jgi:hypothetical protein